MADPRYYQLWAARPSTSKLASSKSPQYRVDLDAPGGITYAPSSETSSNTAKRRLFIPRRGAIDDEYDFGFDVAENLKREKQRLAKEQAEEDAQVRAALSSSAAVQVSSKKSTAESPFAIGDDDADEGGEKIQEPPSEAQLYAQAMTSKASQESSQDESSSSTAPPTNHQSPADSNDTDSRSTRAPSLARSHLSTITAADLARRQGVFQSPAMLRNDAAVLSTFRPPPSISGDSYQSKTPWNAQEYRNARQFDKLTEEERERGYTKFEEFSGEGNVPTVEEVTLNAQRDAMHSDSNSDAATIRTARTTKTMADTTSALQVSDLFIPDPRPNRPLRLVRRSDPQQALVLCSGVVLSRNETKSLKAAQMAVSSGKTIDEMLKEDSAKKLLAEFGGDESDDIRGGLGIYFCPPDPTHHTTSESPRYEPNFARRMERVTFPYTTTPFRASLRCVIAALEYIPWAAEGFSKLVIATSEEWLIRGIVYDIHEWRSNEWRLTRKTSLGLPGDDVPDKDLWELLDYLITQWEQTDCSVRFWCLKKGGVDMSQAEELASKGACKDDQQPQMVKWTKKVKSLA